jgi:hypothetical protein
MIFITLTQKQAYYIIIKSKRALVGCSLIRGRRGNRDAVGT